MSKLKQHIVSISYDSDMEDVKDSMYITMNDIDSPRKYFKGKDKSIHRMMIATHSPLNGFLITVRAFVEDRTHTHLRTHSTMSNIYFCGSSRGDLSYGKEFRDDDGVLYRYVKFKVDLKRFIEISSRRMCPSASVCTRDFWNMLADEVFKEIPELEVHAKRPCVHTGFCTEGAKNCQYTKSNSYEFERNRLIDLSQALLLDKNKKPINKQKWIDWKEKYTS